MSVEAVIALGSNLGDQREILAGSVKALREHPRIRVVATSPIAVTAPVGGPEGQPDFLNMVLRVETELSPFSLLRACQEIERAYHRERTVRWGPRTVDLDIVTYGDLHMDEPDLMLPHPRAHQRAFVLAPWARMEPEAMLDGVYVWALADRAPDAAGIRGYLDLEGATPVDEKTPHDPTPVEARGFSARPAASKVAPWDRTGAPAIPDGPRGADSRDSGSAR